MTNGLADEMINAAIGQLRSMLKDAKQYVLQKEYFDRYLGVFANASAQLISTISNPAIRVFDIEGKMHFLVASEKWKLFMVAEFFYSVNGNEGQKEIHCTNPIEMKYDTFIIDKKNAIKAMNDYETLYDDNIRRIMDINDLMSTIQGIANNSDKLKVLESVIGMIEDAVKANHEFYEISKSGN